MEDSTIAASTFALLFLGVTSSSTSQGSKQMPSTFVIGMTLHCAFSSPIPQPSTHEQSPSWHLLHSSLPQRRAASVQSE